MTVIKVTKVDGTVHYIYKMDKQGQPRTCTNLLFKPIIADRTKQFTEFIANPNINMDGIESYELVDYKTEFDKQWLLTPIIRLIITNDPVLTLIEPWHHILLTDTIGIVFVWDTREIIGTVSLQAIEELGYEQFVRADDNRMPLKSSAEPFYKNLSEAAKVLIPSTYNAKSFAKLNLVINK